MLKAVGRLGNWFSPCWILASPLILVTATRMDGRSTENEDPKLQTGILNGQVGFTPGQPQVIDTEWKKIVAKESFLLDNRGGRENRDFI